MTVRANGDCKNFAGLAALTDVFTPPNVNDNDFIVFISPQVICTDKNN